MSADQGLVAVVSSIAGATVCLVLARLLVARSLTRLVRVNYRGESLAAVLGFTTVAGGLAGLLVAGIGARVADVGLGDVGWATLAVLLFLGAGGAADDLRGDERAKGFSGHIRAALGGRITGGFLKILAGACAGLVAATLVSSGRAVVEIALLVALTANLLNLFDRAPGRASKVALGIALPLVLFGPPGWTVATAGMWGASAASLPADLAERAMLGDTGANSMGGVLGLGLGLALDEPMRVVALVVILGLNFASERWSFSQIIERNGALRAVDRVGRIRG